MQRSLHNAPSAPRTPDPGVVGELNSNVCRSDPQDPHSQRRTEGPVAKMFCPPSLNPMSAEQHDDGAGGAREIEDKTHRRGLMGQP